MNYEEARKKVQADKPKENFMLVELSYDKKIILPYKDGVLFMSALATAEVLSEKYNERVKIGEFERNSIRSELMSYSEYARYKIAALLNVDPKDLKQAEQQSQ